MDQLIMWFSFASRLYKRVLMFMQMEATKLDVVTSENLIGVVCASLPSNIRLIIQSGQSLPNNGLAATSVLSVIELWD
uniref:Uncharacterized protein n=1 Tax=Oryza punctata TaxID=4537 RepID=A0A0E0L272_ORYPU